MRPFIDGICKDSLPVSGRLYVPLLIFAIKHIEYKKIK